MTAASVRLGHANRLAIGVPAALLAGAWGSQLLGGLYPCEMCHWQRWPHYAALVIAALAWALPAARRPLVLIAAFAIAVSGAIGLFHAGVEYHWWEGVTRCARTGGATLAEVMAAPIVRCDVAQWTLFGISLAGYNAIVSLGSAAVIGWLAGARR